MEHRKIGGVRIKNFNATWPLAKLIITPQSLLLNLLFFKTIRLTQDEVSKIKEYNMIPVLAEGIVIQLKQTRKFGGLIPDSNKIIFWYPGNKKELIRTIHSVFLTEKNNTD